jgi:hypothetical protein
MGPPEHTQAGPAFILWRQVPGQHRVARQVKHFQQSPIGETRREAGELQALHFTTIKFEVRYAQSSLRFITALCAAHTPLLEALPVGTLAHNLSKVRHPPCLPAQC